MTVGTQSVAELERTRGTAPPAPVATTVLPHSAVGNVLALAQRELAANFLSPVAYIVASVFLVASGYLFMATTLIEGNEATVRPLLESMAYVLVFAVPLLTMRVIADECATGTIETLMTAPVTDVEVVLGKFLGVMAFYLALLFTTIVHVLILLAFGGGDAGVIAYGYLGMVLLGCLFVSVGLFASALTRYQLVAALIGMGVLSVFTIVVDALAAWQGGLWRTVLSYINILYRFEDFSKGIFDTGSIVFFVSGAILFLFLTVKVLEARRWR